MCVAEYIEFMWEDGESRSRAGDTLSGLQHQSPALKRSLPCSWRLVKAWQKAELPARAPPITEEITQALVGAALALGWNDIAVLTWIAFECLLRTGEMLALKKNSLALDLVNNVGVVDLGMTKSGQRAGAKESVTIEDPSLCRFAEAFLRRLEPGDPLLRRTHADYRNKFKALCKLLGLEQWDFKPYSLRRGGATHHFRKHGALSRTVVRGRWGNAKTARIYLNEGVAVTASIMNSVQNNGLLHRYRTSFLKFLATGLKPRILK